MIKAGRHGTLLRMAPGDIVAAHQSQVAVVWILVRTLQLITGGADGHGNNGQFLLPSTSPSEWMGKVVTVSSSLIYNKKAEVCMKEISTPDAPQPAGHYAQAIRHQGVVYVSGQLPIDPRSNVKHVGPIEEQTQQALENLAAILDAAGSGKDQVLKVTVYISDIALWDRVNKVYARFFGDHRPARAIVPTRELHFGYQIEIDAVATCSNG